MTQSPIEPRHKDEAAKAAGYDDCVQAPVEQRHRDAADDEYWSRKALAEAYANLEANHHKIKAMADDLAEIDRLCVQANWCPNGHSVTEPNQIANIASLYRTSDPVVEAIREMALSDATQDDADRLRKALASRGLEIVERRDR